MLLNDIWLSGSGQGTPEKEKVAYCKYCRGHLRASYCRCVIYVDKMSIGRWQREEEVGRGGTGWNINVWEEKHGKCVLPEVWIIYEASFL